MSWDSAYSDGWAPWDIGRPQSAFIELVDAGQIGSPVLDSGCGTGENSLLMAERGHEVTGVDIAPTAIERAREKAAQRGLRVSFEVGDVLSLEWLDQRFATVIDCGMFHTLDDASRERYVESLAGAVVDGGVVHLLCFSDRVPGTLGPRRISRPELQAAFSRGWEVEQINLAVFDVKADFPLARPAAWLARVVRREPGRAASR